MKTLLPSFLALITLISLAEADEPIPSSETPTTFEVVAYFIRATPEQVTTALSSNGANGSLFDSDQLAKILSSLKSTGAIIFANPRACTINGEDGRAFAGKDFPYPVQYSTDQDSGKRYPTTFERTNLGINFEFNLTLKPDGSIDTTLKPSVVRFLGFVDFSETTPPKGNTTDSLIKGALKEGGVWQPVFSRFEVTSHLILKSGQTTLLGGTSEELSSQTGLTKGMIKDDSDGRLIYVLVTVRILKDA